MQRYMIILGVLLLAAGITAFSLKDGESKAGYVNNGKLYDAFLLKKELEMKLKNTQSERQTRLDSIALGIRSIEQHGEKDNAGQMELMQREYMIRSQQFAEDNERQAAEYEEQIWTQLNQYVQDYGEQNGYAFIYGATGSGSLMYANESYDLTEELIEYVNQKYKGE